MPDSTDVQMCVADSSKVIFLGSTATIAPWGDMTSGGGQLKPFLALGGQSYFEDKFILEKSLIGVVLGEHLQPLRPLLARGTFLLMKFKHPKRVGTR